MAINGIFILLNTDAYTVSALQPSHTSHTAHFQSCEIRWRTKLLIILFKRKKKLAVGYQLHIHKTLLVEQFTPICPEKAHKSTVLRNQDYATWNTLKSPKSLDQNCSCQMAVRVTVDRCECDILLLRLAQIFSPYRKYIDCSLCWIFKNLISHNFSTFFWVNQSELLI